MRVVAEHELLKKYAAGLLGPIAEHRKLFHVEWFRGFFWMLGNNNYPAEDGAAALFAAALDHPSSRFIVAR